MLTPDAEPERDGAHTVRAERVYQQLEREIVDGVISPGVQLQEAALADRLHVSRTPVREALRRLTETGLVRFEANRSYRVAPFDPAELTEIAVPYAALLGIAAGLACPHLTVDDLAWLSDIDEQIYREFASPDPVPHPILAVGVPELLMERCGNRVLRDTARGLQLHTQRAYKAFGLQIPRLTMAERAGGVAAAARSRQPELLQVTVRVHFEHTILDVAELARMQTELDDRRP